MKLSIEVTGGSSYNFDDDIPAVQWLKEIGFEQYAGTFLANFPSQDGEHLLSRRRYLYL